MSTPKTNFYGMLVKTFLEAGITVVDISGRLDAVSSAEAEAGFKQAIESGTRKIAVDMASVDYISSVGLRVLLSAAKQLASAGGKMVLCNLQQEVRQVFEISGLTSIIPAVADKKAAIAEL